MTKRNLSPSPYGGFILTFESGRAGWLSERLYPGMQELRLSESFSSQDWKLEERELACLVLPSSQFSFDEVHHSIAGFVLMRRMHGSGGFAKLKMSFTKLLVFQNPLSIPELKLAGLTKLVSTPENMKRVDGKIWEQLLRRIKQLRPDDAKRLDAIASERSVEHRLTGNSNRIARLNEQRDALGLTLDIGNIDRDATLRSVNIDKESGARSILDLLNAIPVHERSLLEHDAQVFESLLGQPLKKSAIFKNERSEHTIRVYVTDQTDIETAVGTDLIIYNTRFENFLLLQYKKMKKEENIWSYEINPSSNLHQQLARMEALQAAIIDKSMASVPQPSLWSYRLNEDPCYFKFCEQLRPTAGDASLIRGITMPAAHLREFIKLPESKGVGGGISVGYQNCPRYLNNTEFVQLAQSGWIGGGRQFTGLMHEVLNARNYGGRTAMLAVIDGPKEISATARGWKS